MELKNIWIYCRVAYPDDKALDMQKEYLIGYARANGMTVCGVTAESASGTTLSRAGLDEVNREIANGKIHSLLVKDFNRLGRDVVQVMNYIEWLKENSVELIFADGSTCDDFTPKIMSDLIKAANAYLTSQKKTKRR